MFDIQITQVEIRRMRPEDEQNLPFGSIFTDHMFIVDYEENLGWHNPRIVPYQDISISPAAMVFHYGQAVFEGLKAYRTHSGKVLLFRPNKNIERINLSCERLCMPQIPATLFFDGMKTLVDLDKDWLPKSEGTALYIRPFMIATEPHLGVRPSKTYQFMMILSPVGTYYQEGLEPIKIWVEKNYARTVKGGIGNVKVAGNYAASLKSQSEAQKIGYAQVLWLDGIEKKYIEEVGSMNIFFKIQGKLITPILNGSILNGVTRDSVITLCKQRNVAVEERQISIEEIKAAYDQGILEECFGTGTAAVISPVGELRLDDESLLINQGEIGDLTSSLYDTLIGIQTGQIVGPAGWSVEI
ncbi:branched-chain-amino-acid aminotransferase 2 [Clostridia bacterium]|nr:branched-chain-amino-acid aminotransferase 2 [Clostridia bacterium]